jgi:putative sigma-54 modulation protein
MEIKIHSVHFTAKPKLNAFINDRVGKISHFHVKIQSADVCLTLQKSCTRDNKVSEIRLKTPGNDLIAKKRAKTFEEATGQATDALQEQIRKTKA